MPNTRRRLGPEEKGVDMAVIDPSSVLQQGDGLVVVDVQKDFCPGGALPVKEGDRVIPVLNNWLHAGAEKGIPVYASRDWYPLRHNSFREQGGLWPPHCLTG
jgi:nicotinamidase/pyrazinamidase